MTRPACCRYSWEIGETGRGLAFLTSGSLQDDATDSGTRKHTEFKRRDNTLEYGKLAGEMHWGVSKPPRKEGN